MSSSEETTTVENWAEYSDALVDRGRLTIWISEEAIQDWKADREPQQGAQWIFTDGAIETCLQIKMIMPDAPRNRRIRGVAFRTFRFSHFWDWRSCRFQTTRLFRSDKEIWISIFRPLRKAP